MLVKAGSKLFLAGEYAILKENSYAIVCYMPYYTFLEIINSDNLIIETEVEDKDNLIVRIIKYMSKNLKKDCIFKYKYKSQLYSNNVKYGLGSSASLIIVTIKGILEKYKIKYTKLELFHYAIDFMISENISGSFADIACIAYEENIFFKSSNRIDRNYKIEVLNLDTNLKVEAIWTQKPASSSKMIKNIDLNSDYFNIFSQKSNEYTLDIYNSLRENNILKILKNIVNLHKNLLDLDEKLNIGIHPTFLKEILNKYKVSKVSGAGGGDFILIFSLDDEKNKLEIKIKEGEK